ncbi:MAG: phospholipid/cholesterol/gamma-HCH transport system substrate-binding protein [Saprospiraceae bacterium]|jgi:phospholipid/cholesterol/gamma-HCH transport system substrate-binding protein
MARGNTNTVKLGLFVTTAILIFIVAVYYIGNTQNIFGSTVKIFSVFQNVKGLQTGNNVRYSGINVGIVGDIIIVNDSTIRVDMLLQKEMKAFLKKNAISSIGSDGLVGNVIVNINLGKGKALPVEDGDIIQSYARVQAGDMMNTLGNTTENISLLATNLLEIAEYINSGQGSVATLINDADMANDLQEAIRNLRRTMQHFNSISSQLEKSMSEINQGQGLLGYLLKDSTFEYQINQITGSLDTLISRRTVPIMDKFEQSSNDIAEASSGMKTIINELDLNEGLVGAVLKDSTSVENFKQTMHNLNEGTDGFNENMEALKHNFLFRRYFRKQEKKRNKELRKQKEKTFFHH